MGNPSEVFAILACACDIKVHGIPEKHVIICSDSQAALKAPSHQNITVGSSIPGGVK
jgi:hypothetical protein